MDRLFLLTVAFLLSGYILGIIFCNKPFSLLVKFLKTHTFHFKKLKHFCQSWNDWLFIGFVALASIYFYYYLGEGLEIDDKIQTLIVIGTFSSVIFVTLVKDKASLYRNRPIISVEFDENDPNYYHLTDMHITGRGVIIAPIPTYYVRFKIINQGKQTLENVEVVIEGIEPKPDKFMSLNLNWSGFISVINDIQRTVRLPQGQSRIVDFIEIMKPKPTQEFSITLSHLNDADAERYDKCGEGFRTCTIKPTSLSDIYPAGRYVFNLGIYADNTEPKFIKISVNYDESWTSRVEEMRSRHLRIELLS